MAFDQISLLAAIGFSSAALSATLCLTWLGSRQDTFLLSWAGGLALLVGGVILFGALGENYQNEVQFMTFVLLILGFALVYAGAMQFREGAADWRKVVLVAIAGLIPTAGAFSIDLSGLGTIFGNLGIALLIGTTAYEYWLGRQEAPVPMIANASLYSVTALSFLLCGVVLLQQGAWILTVRPDNWAEDVNAIVLIISITGIGALSLAMNQARIARRHRFDAMTDVMTGLLNRRALMERFEGTALRPGAAVLVLDLDHFKTINDRFGHDAGDLVLRRFGAIIKTNLVDDAMAARIGGEEFCIVMPDTSPQEAHGVAEAIRSALESEIVSAPVGVVTATASVGLAMCIGDAQPFAKLLHQADAALYYAKQAGRNRVSTSGARLVAPSSPAVGLAS